MQNVSPVTYSTHNPIYSAVSLNSLCLPCPFPPKPVLVDLFILCKTYVTVKHTNFLCVKLLGGKNTRVQIHIHVCSCITLPHMCMSACVTCACACERARVCVGGEGYSVKYEIAGDNLCPSYLRERIKCGF